VELEVVGDQRLDGRCIGELVEHLAQLGDLIVVMCAAAMAVAAGSRIRRTSRNSSTVSSRWKSTTKLIASSSRLGSRLVT